MTNTPAPASFLISCSYCGETHTATADGTTVHGYEIFRVECAETTPYGVTAHTNRRI